MTASNPLVEALARTILRHQLGCGQPAAPHPAHHTTKNKDDDK